MASRSPCSSCEWRRLTPCSSSSSLAMPRLAAISSVGRTFRGWQTKRVANELEEGTVLRLDFHKLDDVAGVIPCAVGRRHGRGDPGCVCERAGSAPHGRSPLGHFLEHLSGGAVEKGATSGETFEVIEVLVNCEQNSLIYRVRPHHGGICHTRNTSGQPRNCFYRRLDLGSMRWNDSTRNSESQDGRLQSLRFSPSRAPMP